MNDPWPDLLSSLEANGERELEEFYAHLVLRSSEKEGQDFLDELLSTLTLSASTEQHLRSQGPARLLVYRELVRGTFREVLQSALPRATARMGADFDVLLRQFLGSVPITSRCLRDVTTAFLETAPLSPIGKALPAYIWDLAALEAIRITVAAHPETSGAASSELELESKLLFDESAQLLHLGYAVHQLADDANDRELPVQRATHLLVFRDRENDTRYYELSALAFAIIEKLMAGDALGAALQTACTEASEDLSEAVLSGTAQVLSDLAEKGAILGAR